MSILDSIIYKLENYKKKIFKGGNEEDKNKLNELNKTVGDVFNISEKCMINDAGNKLCMIQKDYDKVKNIHFEKFNENIDALSKEEVLKKYNCDNERCISKVLGTNDILIKPYGPKNSTSLLSNYDLKEILERYEAIFDDFKYLNFSMDDWYNKPPVKFNSDVYKLGTDPSYICDIIKKGKKKIGFVLNTDTWRGGGLHWFCIFIDFTSLPYNVEFFNSSSNKPSKNIDSLLNNIRDNILNCKVLNINSNDVNIIHVVDKKHQEGDSECGLYCLYYIFNRCKNINHSLFNGVNMNKINDSTMVEFRKYIFDE